MAAVKWIATAVLLTIVVVSASKAGMAVCRWLTSPITSAHSHSTSFRCGRWSSFLASELSAIQFVRVFHHR
jgi:hypothetical protein